MVLTVSDVSDASRGEHGAILTWTVTDVTDKMSLEDGAPPRLPPPPKPPKVGEDPNAVRECLFCILSFFPFFILSFFLSPFFFSPFSSFPITFSLVSFVSFSFSFSFLIWSPVFETKKIWVSH